MTKDELKVALESASELTTLIAKLDKMTILVAQNALVFGVLVDLAYQVTRIANSLEETKEEEG
jgi:hypothetical protein